MKRLLGILFCLAILSNLIAAQIIPSKTYLIKNPKPNMKERYTPLKLVKIIGPEIGPNVFLYDPRSLTFDRRGNLYIFDRAYGKIVKLDNNLKFVRFIGNEGHGPGEFPQGRSEVFIHVGPNQKLYANDTMAKKLTVFDLEGRYLADYPLLGNLLQKPTVDKNGNIYFFSGNDRALKAVNQNGETIWRVPLNSKEVYSFLFQKQYLHQKKLSRFFIHSYLQPDHVLLYFANSSTMLNVKNNKIARKYRILPEELLQDYRTSIEKISKKNKYFCFQLFSSIVPDQDNEGIYYLPFVSNETMNRSLLYKMNLKGELLETLYVDYKKNPTYTWFEAKKDGLYYANITGKQAIGIFKEETK